MTPTLHIRIEGRLPIRMTKWNFAYSVRPMRLDNISGMEIGAQKQPYMCDAKAGFKKNFCRLLWVCASVLCFSATSNASEWNGCFKTAADRYGVPEWLLWSIAKVESNFNPRAHNVNKNGSEDIGLMQINTFWLRTLKKYGIDRDHLWDGCTSIQIGAWVLAQNLQAHGWNWTAIGAYNAKTDWKRNRYAWKVYRAANDLHGTASAR